MKKVIIKLTNMIIIKFIRKLENKKRMGNIDKDFYYLQRNKLEIINSCSHGYKIKPETNILQNLCTDNLSEDEVHVGDIDQDGLILLNINELNEIPSVEKTKFLDRERNQVSLVIKSGYLAIKKKYGQNKFAFVNEIKALHKAVNAGCNVPTILDIDFENLTLTFSYIKGKVIREELAINGAIIRDSQVGKNSEFSYFKRLKIANSRIEEGKKYLYKVVDSEFIKNTFNEFNKLHVNGVVNNDIKYGNIIIEEGTKKPFIIDFEGAYLFSNKESFRYEILAKHDINILKKHFCSGRR